MTVDTIGEIVVAEVDILPTIRIMTAAAVLAVVASRGILEVTTGTLVDRVTRLVIELGFFPGLGVVALGALIFVVVVGCIGSVAVLAILEAGVVEVGVSPTLGGVVAGGAVLAKLWFTGTVATARTAVLFTGIAGLVQLRAA